MKENFTPAPWKWDDDVEALISSPNGERGYLATWVLSAAPVGHENSYVICEPSDRALISAAPDLYKVAMAFLSKMNGGPGTFGSLKVWAEQATKKARGNA